MTIEQRVAKLERQNRWMKRGGGLALAVVACVVLMGQGKENGKLTLTELSIVDKKGKEIAVLNIEGLKLSHGDRVATLSNSGIAVTRSEGEKREVVNITAGGIRISSMNKPLSRERLTLDLTSRSLLLRSLYRDAGSSMVHLHVAMGAVANLTVSTSARGTPERKGLTVRAWGGASNSTRVEMTGDTARFAIEDKTGFNTVIGTPKPGKWNGWEQAKTGAASIHMLNPKGKVVWQAPPK